MNECDNSDGTDTNTVTRAIELVAICSVNKSYISKEKLKQMNRFLVKRNVTWRSSEFNIVKSFLQLTESELEHIFEKKT